MTTVFDAAVSREFLWGLAAGSGAVLLASLHRRTHAAALLILGAAAGPLLVWLDIGEWSLTWGLLLLALVPVLPTPWSVVPAAAGLVVVGFTTTLPEAGLVMALVPIVGGGASSVVRYGDARTACAAGALTLACIWAIVPDTEEVLAVGGLLSALLCAGMVSGTSDRVPAGAVLAVAAAVLWAAAEGGRGRPSTVVAASAAMGVFLVAPLIRLTARSPRAPRDLGTALLGVHAAIVLTAVVAARAG